jgi:hypothetical protein
VHVQFFHQLALAGNAVQITQEQNGQQELGIDRWSSGFAAAVFQLLPYKLKTGVFVDQPQQMVFTNLIFQTEVIEERF